MEKYLVHLDLKKLIYLLIDLPLTDENIFLGLYLKQKSFY